MLEHDAYESAILPRRISVFYKWEYAARCADGLTGPEYFYSGTNSLDELTNYAWYSGNSDEKTHEVKKKTANTLGLYDMTGNVWERCWDWASPTSIPPSTGFSGAVSGTTRVLRGNSWAYVPEQNTVICPGYYNPCGYDATFGADNGANHGFHVVRSASYVFHDSVTMLPAGTEGTAGTTGSYAMFGDFPQTIKASSVTVDETKTFSMGGQTYYKGSDGNWYAQCTENAADTGYTYSDGTPVAQGGTYKYFKVEPIKWRVLTTDFDHDGNNSTAGKKFLLAENILTGNVKYYLDQNIRTISEATVYPNNYKYSTVPAYLNGSYESIDPQTKTYLGTGFLQSAFTRGAQSLIETTNVDNSADSTTTYNNDFTKAKDYACENTTDKIFLLSAYEVTNPNYDFTAYNECGVGNARIKVPTDYAKANGAYQNKTEGFGGDWWLRTALYNAVQKALDMNVDGQVGTSNLVRGLSTGVVPALCVE